MNKDLDTFDTGLTEEHILQNKISPNVRRLSEFLSNGNYTTEKHNPKTNIINRVGGRTYHIPINMMNDFFSLLDACRAEKRLIHYMERQETSEYSYSGIMHDCDRYQLLRDRQMEASHLQKYAQRFTKLMKAVVNFEEHMGGANCFNFMIFFIRKPAVVPAKTTADGQHVFKDGWHMLIPQIQLTKPLKKYLVNDLLAKGIPDRIFNDIENIEPPNKMIDKCCSSNPVFFYGNCKPESTPYILEQAFDVKIYYNEDADEDDTVLPFDLTSIADNTYKLKNTKIPMCLTYELSLATYLETFDGNPTWLKKQQFNCFVAIESKVLSLGERSGGAAAIDDIGREGRDMSIVAVNNPEIRYLDKLLNILDDSYVTEYEKWFKVLCAIAYTGHDETYKMLAISFSKRCPDKWDAAAFEAKWQEAINCKTAVPLTRASIVYWAKQSSPQKFADINKNNYVEKFALYAYKYNGKLEHAHVAEVLKLMIGDKFVVDVDSAGKYNWYEFVTDGQSMRRGELLKWRMEPNPDNVHIYISSHLPHLYEDILQRIKVRRENATAENEIKLFNAIEKSLRKSQAMLSNNAYQNGIIEQSKYFFRNRRFYEELDSYDDVIGVGNGVLRIGATVELLDGYHEYFISKFTPTKYIKYDPNNPYIAKLLGAFKDIYPENDVREFIMYFCATMLSGKPAGVLLHAVGGGQNAKTFVCKMIHETLGEQYMSAGKTSLLTAPSEKSESHNSALMQLEGKRGFYFDETNPTDIINPARLKSIINTGFQSGRELHAKQKNFRNTASVFLLSNYDLIINTFDHGTWRRLYYYRHKVKFCADPNPNNPYEKKEDKRFMDDYTRDDNYRAAMLSIMAHYYQQLCLKYGGDISRVPVPTIEYETAVFRNKQDHINRFISEMVIKSAESEQIPFSDLIDKYIVWYGREFRDSRAKLTTDNIRDLFLSSRLAPHITGTMGVLFLSGHRIKQKVEDALMPGESSLMPAVTRPQTAIAPMITPPVAVDTTTLLDNIADRGVDLNRELQLANITHNKTASKPDDNLAELEKILGELNL